MIHEKIKAEIKTAMKEKNAIRLSVMRDLANALTNELIASKRKPDELLEDESAVAVIRRAAKQRKDSIEQFRAGGRNDLAQAEEAELAIVEAYLPPKMSEAKIEELARAKIEELGVTTKQDSGKVIGALMKDLKGKADGSVVKKVAEDLLD